MKSAILGISNYHLLTANQISQRIGCSVDTVYRYLKKLGLHVYKRPKRFIIYNDKKLNIQECSIITKLPTWVIDYRIYKAGWNVEKALNTPVNVKYRKKCR